MISYNFLLHLMNDPFTLSKYMERGHRNWGKFIQDEELNDGKQLRENWMLSAHLEDSSIPDHIYDNWDQELQQDSHITNISLISLKDVFLVLLPKEVGKIFELDGNLIVVKEGQFDYWQHLSKSFSPLVLEVAFLWSQRHDGKIVDMVEAINVNFTNTAIPPHRNIRSWTNEVVDTHIHFNSGLEADYKWLKVLNDPKAFVDFAKLKKGLDNHQRKGIIKDYDSMYKMLKEAADYLFGIKRGMNKADRMSTFKSDLATHAWVVYHCFLYLSQIDNNKIKLYRFHEYLLIAGTFRRLFVVQNHQVGLEQFNHVLHTPFKGPNGEKDDDIARQLLLQQVNDKSSFQIKKIEFRIGASQIPKITTYKKGFGDNGSSQIGFICSLIKNPDSKKLKKDLVKSYDMIEKSADDIVGIDVTGKDYCAPPSAFKDAFDKIRKMKKQSPWRFTYHAGEDFYHILTGMRMIYEAVTLLELQPKDRLGHASAAGVDPRNWARCIHGVVPIKQAEYREDLYFALKFIDERKIKTLQGKKNAINLFLAKKMPADRIITVESFQFFDEEELRILQKELLFFLSEKGIVIEACPTSNICIGYDHSLQSYHLRTWLRWKYIQYLPIPDIVIGSDEIGVFPTNISNEYACVYEMIMMDDELKGHAKRILDDLARNSMKYAFKG